MSYYEIDNLYKSQTILQMKEVYALEKIHGCVKHGTLITLSNGEKIPIERIRKGFFILSYNEYSKTFVPAEVEKLLVKHKNKSLSWFKLDFNNGNTLICTEDHPILTYNRGWVIAKDIKSNDDIISNI